MAAFNHNLPYRPIRCGIAILNLQVNKPGTLGCILTSNNADRWILSCYHVLGRLNGAGFPDGEPVFQPGTNLGPVARNSVAQSDPKLDFSAAKIEPGILCLPDVLGLPPLKGAEDPIIGMRVIKSGAETGVTEGVVEQINGDDIQIAIAPGIDPNYEISGEGDSGSVWISRASSNAVALHKAGSTFGVHRSFATKLSTVLNALNMALVLQP